MFEFGEMKEAFKVLLVAAVVVGSFLVAVHWLGCYGLMSVASAIAR